MNKQTHIMHITYDMRIGGTEMVIKNIIDGLHQPQTRCTEVQPTGEINVCRNSMQQNETNVGRNSFRQNISFFCRITTAKRSRYHFMEHVNISNVVG